MKHLLKKFIEFINKMLDIEIIRYGISGGLVTAINIFSYYIFIFCGLTYYIANLIGLIASKIAGYLLNKLWVYKTKNDSIIADLMELIRFAIARGFTALIDFFGIVFLVEYKGIDKFMSKWIIVCIVIVLNYVLGKKAVFLKNI